MSCSDERRGLNQKRGMRKTERGKRRQRRKRRIKGQKKNRPARDGWELGKIKKISSPLDEKKGPFYNARRLEKTGKQETEE
jgi:hypothetical protein